MTAVCFLQHPPRLRCWLLVSLSLLSSLSFIEPESELLLACCSLVLHLFSSGCGIYLEHLLLHGKPLV